MHSGLGISLAVPVRSRGMSSKRVSTYHFLAFRKDGSSRYHHERLHDSKLMEYLDNTFYQKGFSRVRVMDESMLKDNVSLLVQTGLITPQDALRSPESVMRQVSSLMG